MNKRFIALILAAIVSLGTLVGCNEPESSGGSANLNEKPTLQYDENEFLINNGETQYEIIFPSSTDSVLEFAKSEMVFFMQETTGCRVAAQSDEGITYSEDARYISVGETSLLESAGVEVKEAVLSHSGYIVKTVGKSIFIVGAESMGTLCGVYQFFEDLFGFKVYSEDEIYFKTSSTVALPLFNVEYCPSLDYRISPHAMLDVNLAYGYRLKMESWHGQFIRVQGTNMDTALYLAHPANYLEGHRLSDYPNNWYLDDAGTDLCFSNEDLWEVVVENMKEPILANPDKNKIMIGQQDNKWWCTCPRCLEIISRYGANSATAILMANYVETEINQWLKEIGDERTMLVGVFTYQYTKEAPVIYDKASDTFTPTLKANKNVFAMYAPIEMSRDVPITDLENLVYANQIRAWNEVVENLYVWGYCTSFSNYIIDCPNWSGTYHNYKFLEENGVDFFYDQGQSGAEHKQGTQWLKLRSFLSAQLSFDNSRNMETLVDEWFEHYFKQAKEPMYKYYNEMRDLEEYNLEYKGYVVDGSTRKDTKYWPRATLLRWEGYINDAYQIIEDLKTTNPDLYQKLYKRINLESIMIRYLLIELYADMYSATELLEMKLRFKKDTIEYGVALEREQGRMADLYNRWGV